METESTVTDPRGGLTVSTTDENAHPNSTPELANDNEQTGDNAEQNYGTIDRYLVFAAFSSLFDF